jgi:hypothetical protein
MKEVGFMNIAGAIIAGILGTLVMVAFVLASPTRTGMFKLDLVGYVGSMFTANLNLARLIGLSILTFNGAILAIISAFLWDNNVGSATWPWGLIFGAVLGCLSLLVMLILGRIHPRPSNTKVASQQTIGVILWLGHMVYGLITVLVYTAF